MGIVELIQVGQPVNRAAVAEVPMKGAAKKRFDPLLAQVAGQDRGERGPPGGGGGGGGGGGAARGGGGGPPPPPRGRRPRPPPPGGGGRRFAPAQNGLSGK
jgi:hypothetical protein